MQRLAVPALQFQDLLGMNPYELSDGNVVDKSSAELYGGLLQDPPVLHAS